MTPEHLKNFRSKLVGMKNQRVVIGLVNNDTLMGTILDVGADFISISDCGIEDPDIVAIPHIARVRKMNR